MGKQRTASRMFENDNPEDRKELIKRLIAKGLPAFEFDSGGGITHIVVPLLQSDGPIIEVNAESAGLVPEINAYLINNPYNPHLFIATNSLRTSCEIGLMGEDAAGNFISTNDWEFAPEIEKAELIFERFWKDRDVWLKKWIAGQI